jgi:hypothetical protein
MLLQALPEGLKAEMLANRVTKTVEIIFRVLTRYQPGELGEKALLRRQLVDGKAPVQLALENFRNELEEEPHQSSEVEGRSPRPTLADECSR